MSVFGNYNDLAGQIIKEGQEISLVFTNNGDGTGTVSWNIPPPANGCTADSQAYDGIVITASYEAANYITTSPKNKQRYTADPTLNLSANMGSTLDTAKVIGAFYNDKTTTSLTVTDVDNSQWYYISGYAVDNVGTYHREGVHAYSVPTPEEGSEKDYNAYQNVIIVPQDGSSSNGQTLTGLDINQTYTFTLKIDCDEYPISIKGYEATNYDSLIKAINNELKKNHTDAYISPLPPHTNEYYFDGKSLKLWTGDQYVNENVVIDQDDPSLHTQGVYWYNPDTGVIKLYETAGWVSQYLINYPTDPTHPSCGDLWFDGTNAYEWDGDHWIKLCTYIQTYNPLLPPTLTCGTYWYNSSTGILDEWDMDTQQWNEVLAIVGPKDPNTLMTGDFWYNETDSLMYKFSAGQWNQLLECRYDTTEPTNPAPNIYWYNPDTQLFVKRDASNTQWISMSFTMYPTDPTIRSSNDIWWEQGNSHNELWIWDVVNNQWLPAQHFYQTSTDPSLAPNLPSCAVWYNPTDQSLTYIIKNGCSSKGYINSLTDPTKPQFNWIWHDTTHDLWYAWENEWVQITPFILNFDPYNIIEGYFWYNPINKQLSEWHDGAWINVPYSSVSLEPALGFKWFNTVTNEMYEWDGNSWEVSDPIAYVVLKYTSSTNPDLNNKAFLQFQTTATGCCHYIEIVQGTAQLFTNLKQSVIYGDPVKGNDGVTPGVSYLQLGVGTDGSPEERRVIHDYIREYLGFPVLQVELFKSQIDHAIDTALGYLRKYSGWGRQRNLFFMNLRPNQQIYLMTDQCVGFNKVVDIVSIQRARAGAFRSAYAGNELFGIAALQQLYTVGTFDMLSFHLMSSYIKELEILFAARIMFNWVERTRQLKIFQQIMSPERVLVDAYIERTEQDLLTSRETQIWIKRWALAEAKQILGNVRGKYVNLAGPNGSTSLNAQDLLSQGTDEKTKLMEELYDPAMQGYTDIGASADIAIG